VCLEKLANHHIGVETDRVRIGANVGALEDPSGPIGEVVTLEAFKKRQLDLRLLRDRPERDASIFTLLAHTGAETLTHIDEWAWARRRPCNTGSRWRSSYVALHCALPS
jgi:hypothetical protein